MFPSELHVCFLLFDLCSNMRVPTQGWKSFKSWHTNLRAPRYRSWYMRDPCNFVYLRTYYVSLTNAILIFKKHRGSAVLYLGGCPIVCDYWKSKKMRFGCPTWLSKNIYTNLKKSVKREETLEFDVVCRKHNTFTVEDFTE